jgi:hypothetical protein
MQLMEIARTRPMAVPAAGVEDTQADPLEVNTLPEVPGDVNPVPPLAAASAPLNVLLENAMVLFVTVCEFVAVRTLLGVMMLESIAMIIILKCKNDLYQPMLHQQ